MESYEVEKITSFLTTEVEIHRLANDTLELEITKQNILLETIPVPTNSP